MALTDHPAHKVLSACKVPQDHLVLQVIPVFKVCKAPLDLRVQKDLVACWDQRAL